MLNCDIECCGAQKFITSHPEPKPCQSLSEIIKKNNKKQQKTTTEYLLWKAVIELLGLCVSD